jgi:hypothetical protein
MVRNTRCGMLMRPDINRPEARCGIATTQAILRREESGGGQLCWRVVVVSCWPCLSVQRTACASKGGRRSAYHRHHAAGLGFGAAGCPGARSECASEYPARRGPQILHALQLQSSQSKANESTEELVMLPGGHKPARALREHMLYILIVGLQSKLADITSRINRACLGGQVDGWCAWRAHSESRSGQPGSIDASRHISTRKPFKA